MAEKDQDPITELVEWQEHQYNPGYWPKSDYWRNRLSPSYPPAITVIEFLIIVSSLLFASYQYFFVERNPYYLVLIGILSEIGITKTLFAIRRKSSPYEQNEIESKNKRKKKRGLPKRPKNYR